MTVPWLVSRNLGLRDRVAGVIVTALTDEAGLLALRNFALTVCAPPDEVEAVAGRLRSGVEVAEVFHREVAPTAAPLERVLMQGGLLFRAGLFFEVHEVLEAIWHGLENPRRTVVQGLIQIAVGMHHFAHGNPRGAASLFASGRAKLEPAGAFFEGIEVSGLLSGLEAWEVAVVAGRWPMTLGLPPFVVRTADGRRVGDLSFVRARPPSPQS